MSAKTTATAPAVAQIGSVVHIRYRGGVAGEEPQDVRVEGDPLRVMIGAMSLPRGIESAIVGMHPGEEREVDVAPDEGYGAYREELVDWYPRVKMPDGYGLHAGDMLFYTKPDDGSRMPAWVVDETEDNVRVDFNHPFAGKDLHYWIRLDRVE